MRRLASFFAVLLLLSTAAPIMACATGTPTDRKESACCRAMHGNCGEMAKMGCCQVKAHSEDRPLFAASAPTVLHPAVSIDWLLPVLPEAPASSPSLPKVPDAHSPPGLTIARTTVLRI